MTSCTHPSIYLSIHPPTRSHLLFLLLLLRFGLYVKRSHHAECKRRCKLSLSRKAHHHAHTHTQGRALESTLRNPTSYQESGQGKESEAQRLTPLNDSIRLDSIGLTHTVHSMTRSTDRFGSRDSRDSLTRSLPPSPPVLLPLHDDYRLPPKAQAQMVASRCAMSIRYSPCAHRYTYLICATPAVGCLVYLWLSSQRFGMRMGLGLECNCAALAWVLAWSLAR